MSLSSNYRCASIVVLFKQLKKRVLQIHSLLRGHPEAKPKDLLLYCPSKKQMLRIAARLEIS